MVNMKILDLPLKAKWYEMIESGNKKEEYREIKKYWIGRLAKCGGRNSYEKTGFYCKKGICFSCITRGNGFHPKEYTHVRFRFGYTKRTIAYWMQGRNRIHCIIVDSHVLDVSRVSCVGIKKLNL